MERWGTSPRAASPTTRKPTRYALAVPRKCAKDTKDPIFQMELGSAPFELHETRSTRPGPNSRLPSVHWGRLLGAT